jgi:hypothetical protein
MTRPRPRPHPTSSRRRRPTSSSMGPAEICPVRTHGGRRRTTCGRALGSWRPTEIQSVTASMGVGAPVRRARPWRSAHPSRGRDLGFGSQSAAASMGFGEGGRYAREVGEQGREGAGGRWRLERERLWLKYVCQVGSSVIRGYIRVGLELEGKQDSRMQMRGPYMVV